MSTVIGIDLGTSTTEAAVIRDGKPIMIINEDGQVVIPSAVGVNNSGEYVIGELARAQYLLEPENTAIEIKRKIGKKEKIRIGEKMYSAVELSSMLLKYVKDYAAACLKEEIDRAVISVPAYFDDLQRQETMEAGTKAGFTVERIVNEPTAAALSYGLEHMDEESHILVYDLGGGTFDVTLLEMFGGVLEVKASSGDNALGGKDIDERLVQWLREQFLKKHGIDLSKDLYAQVKLKEQAEWCKKELSVKDSCQILIPFLAKDKNGNPVALEETITVEQFEDLIRDLIERTHEPIDVVLADAGILPSDIDKVLLVGGSTRIPLVKKDIEKYLNCTPSLALNPDYAVSEGAAILAGMIEGTIDRKNSLIMTDVNPFTLGVRVMNGYTDNYMSVIIPRNVTIPVTRKQIYSTFIDWQTEAKVEVYQGESSKATRNHFLGEFMINGIPAKRAGEETLEVSFSYDLNGMLCVAATVLSTQKQASITINMMQHTEEKERTDISKWKEAKGAKEFRTVIRRAEKVLKKLKEEELEEEYEDLEDLLFELKEAIVLDELENAREIEEEIFDFIE